MIVCKKSPIAITRACFVTLAVLIQTILSNSVSAQSLTTADNDTVALVNGKPITSGDFKERFELTIYPHKEDRAALQAEKERFLFSLIAEQLLADEGIKSGKFMTPQANKLEREATETYLRDALYRREILGKVRITDKEVIDGTQKAAHGYLIAVYYFPDSSYAASFCNECVNMRPGELDSFVVRKHVPSDTVRVVYGELVQAQENAFWGNNPGFLSKPVRGQYQFMVIRIINKELDARFSDLSLQEKEINIRKMIQRRREISETESYVYTILGDVHAGVNPDLMKMLVDTVSLVLKGQMPSRLSLYCNLSPYEIGELIRRFHDEDKLPMISIHWAGNSRKDRSMSLGEVINDLIPAGFLCKDTSRAAVFSGLRYTLRRVVEYSLLAEQAKELNLQDSREVRTNVSLIMRAYFASQMREDVMDTVRLSQSDLDEFMHKYNASALKDILLTLQEFKTRTIDEAVDVYNVVSMLDSVNQTEKQIMMSRMSVDTVRSDAFLLGPIGSLFSRLEPGQIYGPVQNKHGYTLYRLLSKTSSIPDTVLTQAIDTTRMLALGEKRDEVLYRYVASLAAKGSVKVFIEALNKVHVEPIQMFTVRKIGFGGTINAVPSLPVCEDWTKIAPMRDIIIP